VPRAAWPLVYGGPVVEISLALPATGQRVTRTLLADTGAGAAHTGMDLVLSEEDRLRYRAGNAGTLRLGGAFTGGFPAFWVHTSVPANGFSRLCLAVAVPAARLPDGLQGIACFRFLNRFSYGNFGVADQFGLELP
jgi:hypothetical protein